MNSKMNNQLLMLSLSMLFVGDSFCAGTKQRAGNVKALSNNSNRKKLINAVVSGHGVVTLANGTEFRKSKEKDPRQQGTIKGRLQVELARREATKAAAQSAAQ